jgi:hypothetical protein
MNTTAVLPPALHNLAFVAHDLVQARAAGRDARTDPNHRTNGPVSCSDRLPKLALLLQSPVTHTRGGKSVMERTSRDARTSALFIAGVDGLANCLSQ